MLISFTQLIHLFIHSPHHRLIANMEQTQPCERDGFYDADCCCSAGLTIDIENDIRLLFDGENSLSLSGGAENHMQNHNRHLGKLLCSPRVMNRPKCM